MNTRFTLLLTFLCVGLAMLLMITNDPLNAQEEQIKIETKENPAVAESGPPPKIVFDKEDLVWDIGMVAQGGKGQAIMKFKNNGKGVLKIESVKAG